MKEKNKHRLSSALRQMPLYSPPDTLWERIEKELKQEKNTATLVRALQQLPQYTPGDALWEAILADLPPKRRFRSLVPHRIVASVAILIAISLWLLTMRNHSDENLQFTYSHSTEKVSNQLIYTNWNEDEEAFAEILNLLHRLPSERKTDEIIQLQKELKELNSAKDELQEAIGRYNTDEQLAIQLKEIELERTQIAKQLLKKII